MKILELFSGTECLSNAFRARGHECFTVDWDTRFPSSLPLGLRRSPINGDAQTSPTSDGPTSSGQAATAPPSASPPSATTAAGDPATGSLAPKTEKAARADQVNRHTLGIIRTLRPRFFFIENPMGGLRKMDYMRGIPRHLITYCQYGFTYRKATDIWTNHELNELNELYD